jgi:hypothetical protein
MKHKHAEILHAIADGIPVQFEQWQGVTAKYEHIFKWVDFDKKVHALPEEFHRVDMWRIKPAEVPQWRKDMAQALKDGKVVEVLVIIGHWEKKWVETTLSESKFLDDSIKLIEYFYRIRPEPDVVRYFNIQAFSGFNNADNNNLKLTFDANGNLKDSEVLK